MAKDKISPDEDLTFGGQEEKAKVEAAPQPPEPSKPKRRKVIVGVGENGDKGPVRVPHPDNFLEGEWIVFDRGIEVDLDVRTIGLLQSRCVIERERDEETGKDIITRLKTYPVSYADNL